MIRSEEGEGRVGDAKDQNLEGKSNRKKRRTIPRKYEGRVVETVDEVGRKDDKGSKEERLEAG